MTQITGTAHWDPRLVEAALAMNENRLDIAERALKPYLKDDPFDVRAIRMLAELAARIGRTRDAETLLRRAIEIAPNFTAARANLAIILGRTGRPAEALELLDQVKTEEPDSLGYRNLTAATLGRLGDFDEAITLYEEVLAATPGQARVWMSYGHMLKTVGRQADGIAAYRQALSLEPSLGEAWWSLANLKTVRFDDADIAAMRAELGRPGLAEPDRFHLDFALGKAFHDLGRTSEAFAHYAAGNALRRKFLPYDPGRVGSQVDDAIATFEAAHFDGAGCQATDPIFIVGMPRAGSTLVEQILSSHTLVEGTSELPDIPLIARRFKGVTDILALRSEERAALGEDYLRRARVQRRTDRPFFIDKLPNNWLHVPLIRLILPNAKIIDARRHPLGCCFSNYRQHYANGQPFSYDLADLGRYYADYIRLMAHVDAVLPGTIHRIFYEQMVGHTERQVRALLQFCGLEFEPACLEFYRTERAVRTASSEQVRQPIYTDATDEWTRYDQFLSPLKATLGPVLDAYPGVPASFVQR